MAKFLIPSHLHKISGTKLGDAPPSLYPDDQCGGMSFVGCLGATLIIVAVFGIGFAIGHSPLWLLTLLALPPGIWFVAYDQRFQNRERFARARIRRRECIRCGSKLARQADRYCMECTSPGAPALS